MTLSVHSLGSSADADALAAELIEELAGKLRAGENVDVEAVIGQHPEQADRLRKLLPAIQVLAELGESAASGSAPLHVSEVDAASGTLGDFRIVREVGRGGMAVVYEAEQISLGRPVALKVLPLASTMDPRRLQRFHNEARAAASLHHTNIVPVFAVGSERGVHFYAMQLIDGVTLAAAIGALRREPGEPGTKVPAERRAPAGAGEPAGEGEPTVPHVHAPAVTAETLARASLSTDGSRRGREYFRKVAQLGVQTAEALDYAHQMGVVHRDVKPANLMLDARGTLWVTDFGLAHLQQGEANLTMSGDLMGTLRYMSPEQALAKRVVIDHRTDIYSLGATLYELLTLRPAVAGGDRQEVLRRIAFEEPTPPRKIERDIPAELETIALKAMEKNPADRYATAQELADDLRRFLDDRSILARRPSFVRLAARWARRHKPLVGAALAVLVISAVLGSGNWLWWAQKRGVAEGEGRAALREAAGLLEEERWPEALSAARRAEGVLAGVGADPELCRQARTLIEDLEMARRLQEARLRGAAVRDGHFDDKAADAAYVAAFQEYGLEVDGLDPQAAAEQIRARPIHAQLVAALDDWALIRRRLKAEGWKQRLAVARTADPDVWCNRLRDAIEPKDSKALQELAASAQGDELHPATAVLLASLTIKTPAAEQALACLRKSQQRHPADFWLNEDLGIVLMTLPSPRLEEAIRYLTAAVALRPQSPGAHLNLGTALVQMDQLDEAIAEFREALRLNNDYADARAVLGQTLNRKGRLDEAIAELHEALRLKHDDPEIHSMLGNALAAKGRLGEAIAEGLEAIRLKPDLAAAHHNLADALGKRGQLDEAVAQYREAIRLKPDLAEAHMWLGALLCDQKHDYDGAIAAFRDAVRLRKDAPLAHRNLGNALLHKGQLDEAIAAYHTAIRLKDDSAEAHCNLGFALRHKGQLDEAVAEYRKALRLKPDLVDAHMNLGALLCDAKHDYDGAIIAFREALRLKEGYAPAQLNLANAFRGKGQRDEAIKGYRAAIALDPNLRQAHYCLGVALQETGQLDEAIPAYRAAIALDRKFAAPRHNLAKVLYDKKQLAEAIREYRAAIALDPKLAQTHYGLGIALQETGQLDEAISAYRAVIALKPTFAPVYNNLGRALQDTWQLAEAIRAYRRGVQLDPQDEVAHNNLHEAEQLARLNDRLPAVLQGKAQPKDASERLVFAQLCQQEFHRRYAAAARFYGAAFAEKPQLADDLRFQHRYNAACAAALAGSGQGKDAADLMEKDRSRLRTQALDWLRADLEALSGALKKEPANTRPLILQKMRHWLADTDFAGVREPQSLAKLPEAERGDWQKLWADVAGLLARTKEPPPRSKEKPSKP